MTLQVLLKPLKIKLQSLSKRQVFAVVDSTSSATYVLLLGITAAFATPAGMLVASKSSANLHFRGRCIDIDNTTITTYIRTT